MTAWSHTDPGGGDVDGLSALGAVLSQHAMQMVEAHARTRAALDLVTADQWSGAAADAWRERVRGTIADLARLVDQLDARATTLNQYVATVRDIGDRAWPWRRDLVGDGAVVCSVPDDETAERDMRARLRLAELADERASADRVAAGELDPLVVGEWVEIGQTLIAAGVMDPGRLDGSVLGSAMAEQVEEMLADGLTDQEVETLTEILDQWGTDPAAMSALFTTLGGEQTAELLDTLGLAVQDGDLDGEQVGPLSVLLQIGLAIGSRDWDQQTATTFATGMVEAKNAAGAVQLLFSGPPGSAMGEQLTLAVAALLDEGERLGSSEPWSAQVTDGGWTLTRLRDGEDADIQGGIAEIILRHLARYPDSALDWMVGGEERSDGVSRIDYWFGERDWSDGFETVAGLWSVVQDIPGGPASGAEQYDQTRWDALIGANQDVFQGLSRNEWFEPGRLSATARAWLVDAIGAQLPELVEKSLYSIGISGTDDPVATDVPGLGTRLVPLLTGEVLADVLGVVLHAGTALTPFNDYVTAYQDAMFATVEQAGGEGALGAVERAAVVQGLIDGATGGTALDVAAARDRRTEAGIAGAAEALGVGAGFIPGAGGLMAGPAISGGGTVAQHRWADTYATVLAAVEQENLSQSEALRRTVEQLLTEHTTAEMLAQADALYNSGSSIDEQVDHIAGLYEHVAGSAQADAS